MDKAPGFDPGFARNFESFNQGIRKLEGEFRSKIDPNESREHLKDHHEHHRARRHGEESQLQQGIRKAITELAGTIERCQHSNEPERQDDHAQQGGDATQPTPAPSTTAPTAAAV